MPPLSPPPTTSHSCARPTSAAAAPPSPKARSLGPEGGAHADRKRRRSEAAVKPPGSRSAPPASPWTPQGAQACGAAGGERRSSCSNTATMAPGLTAGRPPPAASPSPPPGSLGSALPSKAAVCPLKPAGASGGTPSCRHSTALAPTSSEASHASASSPSRSSPTHVPPRINSRRAPAAGSPGRNATTGAARGSMCGGGRESSSHVEPASQLTHMSACICMPPSPAETPQQSTSCS
mmetsp:Transcript_64775/g.200503  ORF Transcript_64775/g.200503 Transcript_64775/m.200503 type:complete len:236 (-) Transcript_64775:525-1232(-)